MDEVVGDMARSLAHGFALAATIRGSDRARLEKATYGRVASDRTAR